MPFTHLKESNFMNKKNKPYFFIYSLTVLFGLLFALTSCTESEFSSASCNGGPCNGSESLSFNWDSAEWSSCSRSCGGGVRTRDVMCLNANNIQVPDSECVGVKPNEQESCNSQACTEDFSWNVGTYSTCNQPCGGSQSRTVSCQNNSTGAFVADSFCSQTKPTSTQACASTCPPETFGWVPGSYNQACACGVTQITRPVECRNSNTGEVVSESLCDQSLRPSTTLTCSQNNCSTYNWVTGDYSTCSKTCGGGTQSRSLGCIRSSDSIYVAHTLCDANSRPETQRECNTQACAPTCTQRAFTNNISADGNQVDVLLVIDDSGSMYADSSRLATKLSGFVTQLSNSNLDWQMCITSTDIGYYAGRPIQWQGANSGHILRRNSGNLNSIFIDTMRFIGAGFSDDEQGIKAMNLSVMGNGTSNCYRQNAGLSVIVISDENERSVGGDRNLSSYDYKPLEPLNNPQSFVDTVRRELSPNKKLTVNSIVIKDNACRDLQRSQGDRGYVGYKYIELSNLTGGSVSSICQNNYSVALTDSSQVIINNLSSQTLTCVPTGMPQVQVNGVNYNQNTTLTGNQLIFNPVINGPATVSGSYCCP